MLALQDTGAGMTPEVVSGLRAVFTTKSGGGGSGLGLSMVYGFAKQSGGTVTIASEPGRGTTVILFLPLTRSEPRAAAASAIPVMPNIVMRNILLVEDEAAVRTTVRRQLETLGHRVQVAATAADALPILKGADRPDVLVTDVVLGTGMNGIDLAEAAHFFLPGLPVIFIRGLRRCRRRAAHPRNGRAAPAEAVDDFTNGARVERRPGEGRQRLSRATTGLLLRLRLPDVGREAPRQGLIGDRAVLACSVRNVPSSSAAVVCTRACASQIARSAAAERWSPKCPEV